MLRVLASLRPAWSLENIPDAELHLPAGRQVRTRCKGGLLRWIELILRYTRPIVPDIGDRLEVAGCAGIFADAP